MLAIVIDGCNWCWYSSKKFSWEIPQHGEENFHKKKDEMFLNSFASKELLSILVWILQLTNIIFILTTIIFLSSDENDGHYCEEKLPAALEAKLKKLSN